MRTTTTRWLRWMMWVTLLAALLAPALAVLTAAAVAAQTTGDPVDTRSNYALWLVVLATLTTAASAGLLYIPQGWPRIAKQVVVAIVSGVFSGIGTYYSGQLDPHAWDRTWLIVFIGATAIYVVIWQPISDAIKMGPED